MSRLEIFSSGMVRDSHSSRTGWNLYLTWDYGASAAEVKLLCDPTGNCAYGNGEFHAVIQESTDGGKTWVPITHTSPGSRSAAVTAPSW